MRGRGKLDFVTCFSTIAIDDLYNILITNVLLKLSLLLSTSKSTQAQMQFSQTVYYQHFTRTMAGYGVENGRFQPELSAGPEGAAGSRVQKM